MSEVIAACYVESQLPHTTWAPEHLPHPLTTVTRGKAVNPCPGSINPSSIANTGSIQVANRKAAPKYSTKELSRTPQRHPKQGLDPWIYLREAPSLIPFSVSMSIADLHKTVQPWEKWGAHGAPRSWAPAHSWDSKPHDHHKGLWAKTNKSLSSKWEVTELLLLLLSNPQMPKGPTEDKTCPGP